MLIYRKVNLPELGIEKCIFILNYDEENNNHSVTTDVLNDRSKFDSLKMKGLRIAVLPGMKVPVLTINGDGNDLSQVYEVVTQLCGAAKSEEERKSSLKKLETILGPQLGEDLTKVLMIHHNIYNYELIFVRTKENKGLDICSRCGAPVEANNSGVCEYCKSTLISNNYTLVLSKKKMLSQK